MGGGVEDEEALQDTYDTGITNRNLRYSKVVVVTLLINLDAEKEVEKMKKIYRVLMILGSLIGICATVRW